MIGKLISHFKILEKLGEGGMGIVYKAQDTELDRIVALKFLPQRLTSNDAERARFLQEAKAASALNHPNVCTIYGIDEFDGQKFIEMEYVDGSTLRQKIAESPLKINDAMRFAIQIGEALQEAHGKGIIHRDIKCENIMLNSKNQIKVMDFGLAKLKGSLKLTRTSSTVGTLAYMAPEQIQGGEVDARSDIFSFGAVLFELITGHLPFRGEHEAALMYSILNEEPESIQKYRQDSSVEIDRIIRRALEKDPADRYQHVDDMVSELRRVQKQSSRVVRPDATIPLREASIQHKEVRPSSMKLWIGIGGILVLAAVAGLLLLNRSGTIKQDVQTGRKMLVVLPFENLGTPEQEYFADGITEEITSKLSGLSGLGVIARSSAMQYKKSTKPIKQIGEELGVSYILQGTIRWENADGTSRVRVNPQLISVIDGTQIWSQPSEAVLASAFKLQSDIASEVANALNVTLLQHEKHSLETRLTENSDAYDSYLRGIGYLYRSTNEQDYRIAEQMIQRAVDLDPKFVSAYARLAAIHSHIYWEYYDHTEERVRKCRDAAEKALQLDPASPDAHGAKGWYYYHCLRDYDNALKEFNLALESQPNNKELLLGLGSIERRLGKFEDAAACFKRIVDIDPRTPSMMADLAFTNECLRKYSDAVQYYDRVMLLAPEVPEAYYSKAYVYLLWQGDTRKAREVLDNAVRQKVGRQDVNFLYFSVLIDIMAGRYQQTIKFLDSTDVTTFDFQYWRIPKELLFGQLYGYLNRREEARTNYQAARRKLEGEIQQHPDDSRLHSSLGIADAGLGNKEEAIREGKRGVQLLPIALDAVIGPVRVQDLARIYTMVGEYDAALDLLEMLLAVSPNISRQLLTIDPVWNPLHGNPRYQNLIAQQ